MRYSFDPAKQASKLNKHSLDPADAPKVIESGQTVTFADRRFAYGEERFVTLGPLGDAHWAMPVGRCPLGDALVAIITAETENHIRIISMRKADRHEQSIYREYLS